MDISEIIQELNASISSTFDDFKGCYLYGSRARGESKEDSDIDVVALFDEINYEKDYELSGIICDLMYKHSVYIDLQAYTAEDLGKNPVYFNEVVHKGIFYDTAKQGVN